ncbi:ABC transporter permease [Maledivibacter halophilus]|uniref:Transport permease protein n=1 Tax=Maledivibacter halophilus TaxID=36842 RepID=A0A1T5MCI0_9FIRM|nr:ABC transporter permease [Maledivibacter halophilus]SKC85588.1 ABC-type polysaccharide/polyol phosphate export permease [Maledivibacter halophilus]
MEVITVLWREFIFFKRRFIKITSSAIMSPLLYLIAFGWGLGQNVTVEGHNYMYFIIPGIIALSTMNTSFNAVSIRINISKIHEKSFQYYLTSPVNIYLLTLGQILAGGLRGMYAAAIILMISYLFGVYIKINLAFIIVCLLNSLLFSAFGYFAAMVINSHYDMNRFTTFVIVPMTFLCGTFFSLDRMPHGVKFLINLLPLTHASQSLRGIALSGELNLISIFVLALYLIAFYFLGVMASFREIE